MSTRIINDRAVRGNPTEHEAEIAAVGQGASNGHCDDILGVAGSDADQPRESSPEQAIALESGDGGNQVGLPDDPQDGAQTATGLTRSDAFPGQDSSRPAPSGSRPAENTPRPAPSGTSGSLFPIRGEIEEEEGGIEEGIETGEINVPVNLPDVPDEGETAAGHVPDACRTEADFCRTGEPADGSASPSARPANDHPLQVGGVLRIGPMRAPRDGFDILENPELRGLLERTNLPPDTVIEAEAGAQITILDADTHHWPEPALAAVLQAHLATITPAPEAAWISHGLGLKLVYIGPHHEARALAAAFAVPASFHIELLQRTRHPRATSSSHPDGTCSSVSFFDTDPAAEFEFSTPAGPLAPRCRQEALDRLEVEDGGRYDHDRCPITPDAASTARGCVVVLDAGVYCYRCAGEGITYQDNLRPGFVPFSAIVEGGTAQLDRLAASWVHWTHAQFVLRHFYPNLSDGLLRRAYRLCLGSRSPWGPRDPRASAAFNRSLDFLWGDGLWLDARRFQPTRVDNDAADGLPYAQWVKADEDGVLKSSIDRAKRSQVKHRTPEGYTPIRPVIGISFSDEGSIPVVVPSDRRHAIELLDEPMEEEEALHATEVAFPLLDTRYLKACLAAAICAEARRGQPPMLACTGPSGSGKEQHIRLAASFLGEDATKLVLTDEEEKFRRQIGVAVTAGHRLLVFDEMGKVRNLAGKITSILQISGTVQWRPLHENRLVDTRVRAAFFYPCVGFPEFLANSQEFNRRVRHTHLHRQLPNWAETSGGDTVEWRDRTAANARVANSILTHVWRLCHAQGFRFDDVADELDLGTLADGELGMDVEILRQLYRFARGETGSRQLFENDATFTRGWVNLNAPNAREFITPFVPFDDEENVRQAMRTAKNNLEAQPWNDILGIFDVKIVCKVKIHGRRWGLRFQSAEPAMRGQELLNADLPPIPQASSCDTPTRAPGDSSPPPVPSDGPTDPVSDHTTTTAADVLRSAGMPG